MQKKIKSFHGTKINYDISAGKNKKFFLIFIHGVGGNLEVWNGVRSFFHKLKIPTIAIDLRGHGKSDKPKLVSDYELEDFAKDVYEIIKKEKISHPILIGHSLGTMVTLTFHRLYPKLSKKYVLMSGAYRVPKKLRLVLQDVLYFAHPFDKDVKKTVSRKIKNYRPVYDFIKNLQEYSLTGLINKMMHNSIKSLLCVFKNLDRFNERGILKEIKKPVLILCGNKDNVIRFSNSKRLHYLIKNSQLKIFSNRNHDIPTSIPEEVSKEIFSFIKKK
jgi:pimeloyl-ACP methyl ester carboxylesterase